MSWKLAAAGMIILILAGGALAIYGARLTPERNTVEQVLPNERFPD